MPKVVLIFPNIVFFLECLIIRVSFNIFPFIPLHLLGKNDPTFVYLQLIPHKRSQYNVQLQQIHRTNITIIDF